MASNGTGNREIRPVVGFLRKYLVGVYGLDVLVWLEVMITESMT